MFHNLINRVLIVLLLAASGFALTPHTAAQDDTQTYTNTDYGFTFTYPADWTLVEDEHYGDEAPGGGVFGHAVTLHHDGYFLYIGFRESGEDAMIGWSGVPAGEWIGGDPATVTVFGTEEHRVALVENGKVKALFYGAIGPGTLAARDLEFAIRLDGDFRADDAIPYDDLDIPVDVQADADAIVGSLALLGDVPLDNGDDTFSVADYGFTLTIPAGWELSVDEFYGDEAAGGMTIGHSVALRNEGYVLTIGYKHAEETNAQIGATGMPAGDIVAGDPPTIPVRGQAIDRVHLVLDGRIKAVFYGAMGPESLEFNGVQFAIRLDREFGPDDPIAYDDLDIPAAIRDEADAVVASLTFSE